MVNGRLKPCLVPGPISAQKCVDFTCEHNLMPHITKYKLDDINTMIDLMRNDKTTGRMVVVF
jgi:D-arabinose 1-dehydrogenase-like Zn-dependent alcohol dehydrogenase